MSHPHYFRKEKLLAWLTEKKGVEKQLLVKGSCHVRYIFAEVSSQSVDS
jgi:hypothetical protein